MEYAKATRYIFVLKNISNDESNQTTKQFYLHAQDGKIFVLKLRIKFLIFSDSVHYHPQNTFSLGYLNGKNNQKHLQKFHIAVSNPLINLDSSAVTSD